MCGGHKFNFFFGLRFAQNLGWHIHGMLCRIDKLFENNAVRGLLELEIELCNVCGISWSIFKHVIELCWHDVAGTKWVLNCANWWNGFYNAHACVSRLIAWSQLNFWHSLIVLGIGRVDFIAFSAVHIYWQLSLNWFDLKMIFQGERTLFKTAFCILTLTPLFSFRHLLFKRCPICQYMEKHILMMLQFSQGTMRLINGNVDLPVI